MRFIVSLWGFGLWEEDAKSLLRNVLVGDDEEARGAATSLVHRLGADGQFGFGELLRE